MEHAVRRLAVILLLVTPAALFATSPAEAHGLLVAQSADGAPPTPSSRTSEGPLQLRTHRVQVEVTGPVAQVTIQQRFHNRTNRVLEGTYLFPLPEGAAVSNFAMTMGDRMVEGEVMDARDARALYESIVRRRRDPGLLEYVGRGLFRARVFPIPAQGDVDIRLSFAQVLPDHDGTLEFRYPLATDRLHGQPVDEVVVTVDVKSEVPVQAVYSPSHRLAVVREGEGAVHASYEGSGQRQSRDLLLYVGRSPHDVGFSLLGHKPVEEEGTFLAVLAPSNRSVDVRVPKDVIFVLDTSGSMRDDDKIGQARRAIDFGLGVLREGDRFGIVTFSVQPSRFRNRLVDLTSATRKAARRWLADRPAEGGTNLHGGLEDALELVEEGRLTMIVLVSDGRPTVGERDGKVIADDVKAKNTRKARIFTFGVGFDLDVHLLDAIAETARGARDYVLPREELEIATSRFFRKIVDPVVTDLTLDLGEGVHDVYPHPLPDLFAGGQIVVMGRYDKAGPRSIVLRGRRGEEQIEVVYEATLPEGNRAEFLPRLWAGRKVAFLLDEIRLHGENPEIVEAVRSLALKHGLVTPYTSGLVTDDQELSARDRIAGAAHRPPPMTPPPSRGSGGGGFYRGPGGSVPPRLREPSDPTPPPPPPPSGPPATPPPTTPRTPGAAGMPAPVTAVSRSKRLKEAKERIDEEHVAGVRRAGGRTFVQKDKRWVDTGYEEPMKPERIVAFSEAWIALSKRDVQLAQILALGDRILLVWGGKAYEIVPE